MCRHPCCQSCMCCVSLPCVNWDSTSPIFDQCCTKGSSIPSLDCIETVQYVQSPLLYIICPSIVLMPAPLFCALSITVIFSDIPRMPARRQNARDAKQRREEGRTQGCTGFAKHTLMPSSPNASNYCLSSSDNADESDSDSDSSDNKGIVNIAAMSIVAMQHIYSVFLPPHLQPNDLEAKPQEKRSKAENK